MFIYMFAGKVSQKSALKAHVCRHPCFNIFSMFTRSFHILSLIKHIIHGLRPSIHICSYNPIYHLKNQHEYEESMKINKTSKPTINKTLINITHLPHDFPLEPPWRSLVFPFDSTSWLCAPGPSALARRKRSSTRAVPEVWWVDELRSWWVDDLRYLTECHYFAVELNCFIFEIQDQFEKRIVFPKSTGALNSEWCPNSKMILDHHVQLSVMAQNLLKRLFEYVRIRIHLVKKNKWLWI